MHTVGTPHRHNQARRRRAQQAPVQDTAASSREPLRSHPNDNDSSSSGGSGVGCNGMDRYIKLWRAINRLRTAGDVDKIGLCDLTREQLENLCDKSGIIPDMLQVRVGETSIIDITTPVSEEAEPSFETTTTTAATTPSSAAVSSTDPLDDDLREYARNHGISIRTHTDSVDMLPDEAFQTLATDFRINEKFPTTEVPRNGFKMDFMRPRWIANYSVFLKTRGLVANRGYIVMASSDTVLDPNSISKYYGDDS
ncbi:hypothetical protein IW138_005190 [Coemansia sp. RSA 986]|nr:hypothetical protein IW138_005190 [Coemansia sp. RSA 986]